MTEQECRNRIRCAMSDRTGQLRFESFDIADAAECAETADSIREYLVGRALAEVDVGRIPEIGGHGHPLCARVVAQLVTQSQETFVQRTGRLRATTNRPIR